MKKKYLIVSLVQAFIIIALVVLFPVTASCQDLTEAQTQERCQNNRNRLAELEKESKIVNAELSKTWSDEEFTKARDKMVFVRAMEDKGKVEDWEWTKLRTIGVQ